jgi:hypothetical protein
MNDLAQQISDRVTILDDPKWVAMPPERKLLLTVSELSTAILKIYDALATADPLDDKEVQQAAVDLYDKYFVPIDLPFNDMFEALGENYLRGFIPGALEKLAVYVRARNEQDSKDAAVKLADPIQEPEPSGDSA